jgi:hypothetical protein
VFGTRLERGGRLLFPAVVGFLSAIGLSLGRTLGAREGANRNPAWFVCQWERHWKPRVEEGRCDLRERMRKPYLGFPWHAVLPASVKLLPDTGTNFQR